ncbi:hypothetical protein K1719_016524 [Acacia pycnantha]|nr:hypothetical protein K1719_016524 [Acacia pycnantha]
MEEQFMAEVGTVGRVHHLNLVRLIRFCIEKRARRHFDVNLTEGQGRFLKWVWIKFESKEPQELLTECGIEDKEIVKGVMRIALSCVQYKPKLRPKMSDVVKMLEGSMEIQDPPNPFQHLMEENHHIKAAQMDSSVDDGSSTLDGTESSTVPAHPVLEIQIDSSKN